MGMRNYVLEYTPGDLYWNQLYDQLIDHQQHDVTQYPWKTAPTYLDWFEGVSHPYIDPRSPLQDRPCEPVAHPASVVDITVFLLLIKFSTL